MKARFQLIAAFAVVLSPLEASAQAWVSHPDFSEGVGVRTGNLEVHPSVGAEFGYDSNYFRASKDEGVIDVMRLRVTPSVTLSTLGATRRNSSAPQSVVFGAGAYASYNEIFAVDSAYSDVSKRRNVGVGVDAKVDIFPTGKVGVDLVANYSRIIETEGRPDDLAGEGFNRDSVRGGAGVTWRPGGGLFEWRAGYMGTFRFFENDSYTSLNNLQHDVATRGRWRFLPRSSLLFDSTYSFIRYTHDQVAQSNGDVLRARAGFHGLVTYHLSLLGMLGWAATFYDATPVSKPKQFDGLIANAEARWFILPSPEVDRNSVSSGLSSMALGYTRDIGNSYYGSFYQSDRGYVQFNMFLLGTVASGLEFGLARVAFPRVARQASVAQLRIDSRAFAEYRFTETLAANATVQYDQVNSDPLNNEDLDYKRWQAYLGLRWFM